MGPMWSGINASAQRTEIIGIGSFYTLFLPSTFLSSLLNEEETQYLLLFAVGK